MIRILFACVGNDYDEPARGESFEYVNFFGTLKRMQGIQADFFDTGNAGRKQSIQSISRTLYERAVDGKYDIFFHFPFLDEISLESVKKISDKTNTKTLCWFADDHWRFEGYSSEKCWAYDSVVTTDPIAHAKYKRIGYGRSILSQWGFNHYMEYRRHPSMDYNVSFVGQRYGKREGQIQGIVAEGLPVSCFGYGWNEGRWLRWWNTVARMMNRKKWIRNEGRISWAKMLSVFAGSRINLNFSDSSAPGRKQIKARNFEVTGAGGFLLAEEAEGLEEFFDLNKEIITFRDRKDLVEKATYYLAHEVERAKIAEAGRNRTWAEHTYEHRFRAIFEKIMEH